MRAGSLRAVLPALLPTLLPALITLHCTTVGFHVASERSRIDFGKRATLRLCVYRDRTLGEDKLKETLAGWRTELRLYGIDLEVPHVVLYDRTAQTCIGLGESASIVPMAPDCDRVMIILGRRPGDLLWGFFAPTVLGLVDATTGTRGYAFTDLFWIENLLFFQTDADVLVHEGYHLLGCEHGLIMTDCYQRIARLKRVAAENTRDGVFFFPAMGMDGAIHRSREEVESIRRGSP